jgi:hypothetical protein
MINRGELRASLRQTLADTTVWPDAALNRWIDEAVADYSGYFRLPYRAGIPAVTGMTVYELDFAGKLVFDVLTVKYLTTADPPVYLSRMDQTDPRFFLGHNYDIYCDGDFTFQRMIVSKAPGKELGVYWISYEASHPRPTNDTFVLTVPDNHLDALRLYVVWKAFQQIEAEKALAAVDYVDTGLVALPLVGSSAARAAGLYRQKIRDLSSRATAGGYVGPWRME